MVDRLHRYLAKNVFRIGIVGYSGQKFNEVKANKLIAGGMRQLLTEQHLDVDSIEVVSGLSALGIPLLAYQWARANGVETLTGIACKRVKEYDLFPVDKTIIIGNEWGDESPAFIKYCDAVLRVGGGKQSLAECAEFKRLGKPVVELELASEDRK